MRRSLSLDFDDDVLSPIPDKKSILFLGHSSGPLLSSPASEKPREGAGQDAERNLAAMILT
jgi:hypothetical protein